VCPLLRFPTLVAKKAWTCGKKVGEAAFPSTPTKYGVCTPVLLEKPCQRLVIFLEELSVFKPLIFLF